MNKLIKEITKDIRRISNLRDFKDHAVISVEKVTPLNYPGHAIVEIGLVTNFICDQVRAIKLCGEIIDSLQYEEWDIWAIGISSNPSIPESYSWKPPGIEEEDFNKFRLTLRIGEP